MRNVHKLHTCNFIKFIISQFQKLWDSLSKSVHFFFNSYVYYKYLKDILFLYEHEIWNIKKKYDNKVHNFTHEKSIIDAIVTNKLCIWNQRNWFKSKYCGFLVVVLIKSPRGCLFRPSYLKPITVIYSNEIKIVGVFSSCISQTKL